MLTVGEIRNAIANLPDDSVVEIHFDSVYEHVLEAVEGFVPTQAFREVNRDTLVITLTDTSDGEEDFDGEDEDDENC